MTIVLTLKFKSMRRIVLLLFFVFYLSLCGDVMASGIKDDDIVTIPIEKTGEEEQEKNPRGITISPISCIYSSGSFIFSFYEMFESITIQIVNISTGEQWSNYMEYSESSVRIPASTNSGIYNIFIYTEDGYYTGIFHK